jgi:hypothetical protein
VEKYEVIQMEKLTNISNFFHNIMSVDETRVSVLMFSLVGSLMFGAYIYAITGALSPIWADIITTLIFSVAGINAVNSVVGGNNKLGQMLRGGNASVNQAPTSKPNDAN